MRSKTTLISAITGRLCAVALAVVLVMLFSSCDRSEAGIPDGSGSTPESSPSPAVSGTTDSFADAEKLNRSILIFLYDDDDDYEITYDAGGYIIKITDGRDETFEFEYDFDAQTIKMRIYNDGRFGGEYDEIYVMLEYDGSGNIVSETEYHDGEKVLRVEYEYDENGNLTWELTTYYNEDGSVDEQYEYHHEADGDAARHG
jgi:hypothetical protein